MTDLIDSARRIFAQGQFKYVLLMMLLLRVDCLRTTITAFSPLYRGASDQSAGRATRILHPRPSTSGDQKQDSGPDEICIPDMLKDVIVEAIEDLGGGKVKEVRETTPGPGLHSRHFRYTATGGTFLAKVSKRMANEDSFAAERAGLESIPEVLKHLAEGLAAMHLRDAPDGVEGFGFTQDNVLGMSLQDNSWKADFATFMVENRLLPQFERAQDKFGEKYGTNNEDALAFRSMGGRVFDRAKEVLAELEGAKPCLLHGDLWVGNCGGLPTEGRRREAAVFDPACWYGVHEFDLALATMFGGFGVPFYEVYHSIIPKAEGFERRMRFYKLYHYLNHLNLHGAGFGHGGSMESPKGYYERCVGLMQDIIAD